ncbi:MAG: aminoacyl-tRNA hydrolase [PVC group bacterium]|nr:aminoacyl-tRNA hydrolase [PVC group bacterium]
MKLIVGLGNPGIRYKRTKHNAGFWVIDELAKQESVSLQKRRFNAIWAEHRLGREKVFFVKPLTYMNLSGKAVRGFVDYFKISIDNILVIFDDVSLKLGTIRLRATGSAGGHNGVRSLIDSLGTDSFARLRLGIRTEENSSELSDYVLSSFKSKADEVIVRDMVQNAKGAVFSWVKEGVTFAMNKYNKKGDT